MGRKKKILVVEDSKITSDLISSILEDFPAVDVVKAETGFKALRAIPAEGPFDLIITDINMPDITGLELLGFLRSSEEYKNIPIIIVSTEGRDEDIKKGFSMGANEYIVKPFKPEAISRVIKKYLKE